MVYEHNLCVFTDVASCDSLNCWKPFLFCILAETNSPMSGPLQSKLNSKSHLCRLRNPPPATKKGIACGEANHDVKLRKSPQLRIVTTHGSKSPQALKIDIQCGKMTNRWILLDLTLFETINYWLLFPHWSPTTRWLPPIIGSPMCSPTHCKWQLLQLEFQLAVGLLFC